MNREKRNIEISPAIVEQLQDEPTKYWRSNLRLIDSHHHCGVYAVCTSERAAWLDRERAVASGIYVPNGPPIEATRDEVDQRARNRDCHTVEVIDETGAVVDSWSVPQ